ncbi:unnamed protein product, partial [Discosporangium mesarthrocarpum]
TRFVGVGLCRPLPVFSAFWSSPKQGRSKRVEGILRDVDENTAATFQRGQRRSPMSMSPERGGLSPKRVLFGGTVDTTEQQPNGVPLPPPKGSVSSFVFSPPTSPK